MPKLKSHSGAAKRFTRTKNGRIKRRKGFRAHILTKKSTKSKRQKRAPAALKPAMQNQLNECYKVANYLFYIRSQSCLE